VRSARGLAGLLVALCAAVGAAILAPSGAAPPSAATSQSAVAADAAAADATATMPGAATGAAPRTQLFLGGGAAAEWGRFVASETEIAAAAMPLRLGLALPDSVTIVLCAHVDEFRRIAGPMAQPGVLGVARPWDRLVALQMAALGPGPERSLVGTLRHELAHVTLGEAVRRGGVRLPTWFDEGVASWFGARHTDIGALDAASLTRAAELRLERLADGFPEGRERRVLAYTKSLMAIERLEAGEPGAVARIVRRLAAGEDFDSALVAATGLDVDALEEATRSATRRRWLPVALVRALASPYLLLALVVLVGYIARRRRLRRRLAEAD
jgi:hypothetical protein